MRLNRQQTSFLLAGIMALLLVQFQNCARNPDQFTDQEVQKTMDFFEYRYEKATDVYFEIQIVPDTEDATHRLYKLLGFAANSDGGTAAIDYSIEIFGTDEQSICPERTGTLTAGDTLIEESCLLPKTTAIGDAVIKVRTSGGAWNEYRKAYQH